MNTLKNINFILKFVFKTKPFYIIYILICTILQSFNSIISIFIVPLIINMIETKTEFKYIFILLISIFIYRMVVDSFINFTSSNYALKTEIDLKKSIQQQLFEKAINMDLEKYDNPEFYNDFIIINSEMDNVLTNILSNFRTIIYSCITTLGSVAIILNLDLFCLIFVVISLSLSYLLSLKGNKMVFNRRMETRVTDRKVSYINRIFYFKEYATDIRLTSIYNKFIKDYKQCIDEIKEVDIKYGLKFMFLNFFNQFFLNTLMYNGFLTIYLVYNVLVLQSITVAGFFGIYNAINYINSDFWNLIMLFPQFKQYEGYIEKYKTFINTTPIIQNKINALKINSSFKSLELKNISFEYNENNRILKNINMTINKGQKIAIVGSNGAGKSTLIKLILRLYDPSGGNIFYNNIDIKDLDLQYYRNLFSVVFQDFKLFAFTVSENIIMDELEDYSKVNKVLDICGLKDKVQNMTDGVNSLLYKEFSNSGIILSGGEEQKIAIARAFAKNSDLIIMDEPTSSLDPISEYNLNKTILEQCKDKTVIFISHRLSTTVMADKIYMLEDGKIIESGTHKELLSKDGKYAELFKIQVSKYK